MFFLSAKCSDDIFGSDTKNIIRKFFWQHFLLFLFYHYISSPTSESFIAQLLLHRALTQKLYFFANFRGNPWDLPYQLSDNALTSFHKKHTKNTKNYVFPFFIDFFPSFFNSWTCRFRFLHFCEISVYT